jgi:hypothetical protein
MKKILTKSSLLLSLILVFSGCKKELEDKYNNPDKSTKASLPGFFTDILNNDRVRPSYWNVRTFLLPQPAVYSQTAFFSNSNSAYQQSDGYTGQYWSDFYAPGVLGMYRAMEAAYSKLSEAEKAKQEIFMQAARVILFDQASQMVDLWGDIPYSEAGSLELTSSIANPKFDAQAELYSTFFAGLKSSATYFSTATTSSTFGKADILLNGDVNKWARYANSLRLRLLMRASFVNEATSKSEVLEMLTNKVPLINAEDVADYNPASVDILLTPLTTNKDNLNNAFRELTSQYAPDYLLNKVMLPSNDPRIPVMFDKNGNTTYKAMPITFSSSEQESQAANYSVLDTATFLQNASLPGIAMTASEVNFLKAEAYERWGSSAEAKTAYETAVKQSVTFYYYLNSLNTAFKKLDKPTETELTAFVSNSVKYTGSATDKLALIWTQKWLHFGVLQSTQAWSEYRRTDYPQLTFPVTNMAGYQTPPVRLIYPSNEKSYNSTNYAAVQPKDTRTTRIFWDVK